MTDWLTTIMDPTVGLRTIAALLVAKVVLASLSAAKAKEFDWRFLPEFLAEDVLPYGVGLFVLFGLSTFDEALRPLFVASEAAVSAMLTRQSWDHVKALFGANP